MPISASVSVDRARVRGPIDDRVYGQFLEHIGRAVYGGVYDPGSPRAGADGFRDDVDAAVRGLRPTLLRWPGGNFASGYHWRDGVGPAEARPARRDLAWDKVETNAFGTEEFLAYCRRIGAAPYLNLNLSTGTIDEALGWLDYANGTAPVPEVLLRQSGPHPEPHGVRVWGLGNENYGWWQHGHTSAARYAETARECAKLMRWNDPASTLIGVGASADPDWNWTVLRDAGRYIDHLSLHFYWHGSGDDRYHALLAGPLAAEQTIEGAWGMCLAAQQAHKLPRPVSLAVDEWNVWAETFKPATTQTLEELMRFGFSARSGFDTSFEESFDLTAALTVATWLHVMWRHPEKVTLATQAQMVNVIAPILTGPDGVVLQTVYHPLAAARAHAGSVALDVAVHTDAGVPAPGLSGASMPALDAAGTLDPQTGRVHLSLVNRHHEEELVVRVAGLPGEATRVVLWHEDVSRANTAADPSAVTPRQDRVSLGGELVLPPHSHTTLVVG